MLVLSWLRRLGKIRGVLISHGRGGDSDLPGNTRFVVEVTFYNEKRLRIGIREPYVVYLKSGENVGAVHLQREGEDGPVRFLDLPPREWVHLRGASSQIENKARRILDADRLKLTR